MDRLHRCGVCLDLFPARQLTGAVICRVHMDVCRRCIPCEKAVEVVKTEA